MPHSLARLAALPLMLAVLALWPFPARAQPTAQWVGVWTNGEEHTTLTLTGGTLSLAWPDAPAPERYEWTERRYVSPRDLATWGYAPGFYFGFDQTGVSAAAIRASLEAAWRPRLAFEPGNTAIARRYATLRARVDRITPGSYRRIRRFCVNDRRAAADCLAATRNEFFIFDTDHLVLVLIDPAAPETSNVLVFSRAGAGRGAVSQVRR